MTDSRRKPRAMLIDAMHLCYRHYHVMKARKDSYKDDLFVGFYQGIFKSVRFMRKRYPRHDIYFLWDSDNKRRCLINPDYKRKSKTKKDQDKSEKNRSTLYSLLPELKTMLTYDGIHHASAEGYEADDVAKNLVEWFYSTHKEIVLWTGDLDWAQLIMSRVLWMNVGKRNLIYDERSFQREYGFPPEGIRVYKALTGDKSDNIKGIFGFPKKLAKILAGRTPSVEGFFYDRRILNDIPDRWKDAIKDNAVELRSNYQLVTLMKIDSIDVVKAVRDKDKFQSYLEKYHIEDETRSKVDEFYLRKLKEQKNEEREEKKVSKSILQEW